MTIWFPGWHATLSPSQSLLATVSEKGLRVCFTNNPGRCIDFQIRTIPERVQSLIWSPDSARILLLSGQLLEIVDLERDSYKIEIANGSGGLGIISAAVFVQPDQVLTIWEFGRMRLWNIDTMKTVDIEDVKTLSWNRLHFMRPGVSTNNANITYITKNGADECLAIHFPYKNISMPLVKLPTVDATSWHWAPHGNWLAVLDSSRMSQNVHILTADGHRFKSFPHQDDEASAHQALGIKNVIWSHDSQTLALTRFDNCIDIISGSTLGRTTLIEHSRVINQPEQQHVKIWQEQVSATSARTYIPLSMPVSLPLSKDYQQGLRGIVDAAFSCDDTYLVSRAHFASSTLWIWDIKSSRPHSVVLQHNNIKHFAWHATLPSLLMIDCGANIVYMYDVASGEPPSHYSITANGNARFSLLNPAESSAPVTLLARTQEAFTIIALTESGPQLPGTTDEVYEEDSIFEILSGRLGDDKTARLELEAESEYTDDNEVDDTFDGRRAVRPGHSDDPLDDSNIF